MASLAEPVRVAEQLQISTARAGARGLLQRRTDLSDIVKDQTDPVVAVKTQSEKQPQWAEQEQNTGRVVITHTDITARVESEEAVRIRA